MKKGGHFLTYLSKKGTLLHVISNWWKTRKRVGNSCQSKTVKSRNLKFVQNSVFKNQDLVKNGIAETYHWFTYPYSSSCQSRLRNRHGNHISRYKNLSNLISQQQILAIHGSRENPLPPVICTYLCLPLSILLFRHFVSFERFNIYCCGASEPEASERSSRPNLCM